MHQDVAGPAEVLRRPDVKLPFRRILALLEDHHIVRPGNFSHQRCEFFVGAMCLVKQLHSPEVSGGEAGRTRKFRLQVPRQTGDHGLAPSLTLLPGCDHPADIGVEAHQFPVHLSHRRQLARHGCAV